MKDFLNINQYAAKNKIQYGISLSASREELYDKVIKILFSEPSITLDIIEQNEILREECFYVSAYAFQCDIEAFYTYKKTNKDKTWNLMNGRFNDSKTLYVSGNKLMNPIILNLYLNVLPDSFTKKDKLKCPQEVKIFSYDMSEIMVFDGTVKTIIERIVEREARACLKTHSCHLQVTSKWMEAI